MRTKETYYTVGDDSSFTSLQVRQGRNTLFIAHPPSDAGKKVDQRHALHLSESGQVVALLDGVDDKATHKEILESFPNIQKGKNSRTLKEGQYRTALRKNGLTKEDDLIGERVLLALIKSWKNTQI